MAVTTPPNGQGRTIDPTRVEPPPPQAPPPPTGPEQPAGRPRWYRRGWVIGLIALIVGIGLGAASAGSNKPKTTTVTSPAQTVTNTVSGGTKTVVRGVPGPTKTVTVPGPAKTVTQTVQASTATPAPSNAGGHYSGTDTQNLGTINVPVDSTLRWTCSGCSSSNFIINNDPGDANVIAVNSLNETSGQTVISAGTYTKVTVLGTGPWSFTITPGT